MAEPRIPPTKPGTGGGSAETAKRGEQVIQALSRVKPAGGPAARPAPPWVHKLVDILWDIFT